LLDLRRIREQPDAVRQALARRDPSLVAAVDEVLGADSQWRSATAQAESLRATQRASSESIAAQKKAGADVAGELATMKLLSADVKALTEQAAEASCLRACPTCPIRAPPTGPRTRRSGASASRRALTSSRATISSWPAR
jgi:seryl-tRNA synthetase